MRKKSVNKIKKTSPTNTKQYYLKQYLIQRNFTLKDLKCEVILMLIDMLIDNYLHSEDTQSTEQLIDFTPSQKGLIYQTLKDLQEDIQYNVVVIDKLQNIIDNCNVSQQTLTKARLVDSLSFYYNTAAATLKHSLEKRTGEEKPKWIPELIALSLTFDMKEKGYPFTKFSFLEKYDLEGLMEIYIKTNSILKKMEGITISSKERTIINVMQDVSLEVVNKIIDTKYK